ncbi:hypothetical protein ACEPAH_7035 [Sanghuangporus vaninii]
MPNAYDALRPHPNGDVTSTITVNPWDDDDHNNNSNIIPVSPFPTRLINGSRNASTPESLASSTSSSPSPSGKSGLRSRRAGSHRRVSTIDGSVSTDPLQTHSPTTPTQTPSRKPTLDGAITRPTLKRLLGTYSECDLDESEHGSSEGDLGGYGQESSREAEIMVIVHEVTRLDSMAGVALKYGISPTDLRRANHLWASDSIHLRKVLYIPLHLSSRKDLFYPMNEHDEDQTINGESSAESSTSARSSVVIQRIPLSQLAFFPPPSQPSLSLDSDRKRITFSSVVPTPPRAPTPLRVQSESSGVMSLSALFQTLPFPSREVLFPRLSLDSSETSSTASSDQEHEMDILGQSRSRSRKGTPSVGRVRALSSKGKGKAKKRNRNSMASIETLRMGEIYGDDSLDTPLVPLQTEQLKPSPQMQLPKVLKRDDG